FLQDVAVEYETDNLYARSGGTVIAYNAEGRMLTRNDSIPAWSTAFVDGRLVALRQRHDVFVTDDTEPGSRVTLLDIFSPDLRPEGRVETLDKGTPMRFSPEGFTMLLTEGFLSDNGESLVVKELMCDTAFYYRADGALESAYILDLGRHATPAGAFGENATVAWSDDFHRVDNIREGSRYLFVETMSGTPMRRSFIVLDREDPAAGFMSVGPDGEAGMFLGGVKFTPSYIRDNQLVGYMQALDIVDAVATKSITNPDLQALATTLREDSNPVIVVATLNK
ncbi:MAG: hypothetical protein LBU97_01110, partial [Alistipes sp.]|nr:hypothetical protein [Alistipes sp.]